MAGVNWTDSTIEAAGTTVQLWANCMLRVHRYSPIDMTWYSRLTGEPMDPLHPLPQPATASTTVPCGATQWQSSGLLIAASNEAQTL